jgi:hypothetical protein
MPEMTDIRCEDCGAVFPMIVGEAQRKEDHSWFPGRKCPICGSEKFFPVVKTVEAKPIAKWKLDKRVGIAAGAVAGVFLIIGLAWFSHERPHQKGGLRALYMCEVCGERFVRSVTGAVPKKCPECKSLAGYRAVQCLSCYKVYPWKANDWASDRPTCPRCKSKESRILRDFADIQKKPVVPKEKEESPKEGQPNEGEKGIHAD